MGIVFFFVFIIHKNIPPRQIQVCRLPILQQQAQRFQRELADLGGMLQSCVNIDGAWGFMDFALDGFLVDFFVQDKISKSKNQVQNCMNAINRVLEELYKLEQQL